MTTYVPQKKPQARFKVKKISTKTPPYEAPD